MSVNPEFINNIGYDVDDKFTTRVRLFTGYACNYNCNFCFYKGQPSKDFTIGIKKQVAICKLNNIDSIDLSGGEPTIIPDWFDTLEYLRISNFKNIAAITNGSTFSNINFFKRSINCGMNEVLFSYHGSSETIHDSMTGVNGSHKKLHKALDNSVKLGIKIRINTVVTKDNFKSLPMIAKNMTDFTPIAFNFLPFRLENQSTPDNVVSYKESINYIKEAIDILSTSSNILISVRYIPFCVMEGYEKYVCGWLQKLFDPYEWSQSVFEYLDSIRLDTKLSKSCYSFRKPKKDLELAATYNAMKATSGIVTSCLKCSCRYICEGIWKSYIRVCGCGEFKSFSGEKIKDIMHFRREYIRSFIF